MKYFPLLFCLLFLMISATVFSQKIEGAWEFKSADKDIVLLYKDGYFTHTEFTPEEFLLSWGGVATNNARQLKISVEFNSGISENVGKEVTYNFLIENDELQINENDISTTYKRIDDGNAPLAGAWKISAREQDGKIVAIHQTGARKTLKVLTGNRFQWFAINPETKEFRVRQVAPILSPKVNTQKISNSFQEIITA